MSNHSSTPGWAKLKRSTDLSSNLRRRQRIYDQDQSFFIINNKTKSKSKSFKYFAKSTLAQVAQIQLKILVTPLTVPAMRLKRRLGYETEERRLHAHACRLYPQRTSLGWSGHEIGFVQNLKIMSIGRERFSIEHLSCLISFITKHTAHSPNPYQQWVFY